MLSAVRYSFVSLNVTELPDSYFSDQYIVSQYRLYWNNDTYP